MSKRARKRLDHAPPENGGALTALLAMLWLMVVYVLRHPAQLDHWEGWDEWGATQTEANARGWNTTANSPGTQAGRFGGLAYRWPNNTTTTKLFRVASTGHTIGFAWRTTNATGSSTLCEYREGATTHGRLAYNGNGTFTVSRNGTTVGATPTTANLGISAGVWYYFEWFYNVNDSTGSYELRFQGSSSPVASGSGVDTRNGGTGVVDTLSVSQPNATAYDWDDYYECSGSSADFRGDSAVATSMPNADGTYTAWTASAGSDFQCVDEVPYNGDTDYISASAASTDDTFGFPSTGVAGTVLGVQTAMIARRDDAAARNVAGLTISGGNLYAGASQAVGASYAVFYDTQLVDPDTGLAWDMADVNAAELGVRNV